jgi:hypothetical protein
MKNTATIKTEVVTEVVNSLVGYGKAETAFQSASEVFAKSKEAVNKAIAGAKASLPDSLTAAEKGKAIFKAVKPALLKAGVNDKTANRWLNSFGIRANAKKTSGTKETAEKPDVAAVGTIVATVRTLNKDVEKEIAILQAAIAELRKISKA